MTLFRNKYRVESSRLRGWDYSQEGLYFVTICTRGNDHFFGEIVDGKMHLSPIGEIVADEWQKTPQIRANVELDAWMIMPNHLHGIVVIVETRRWRVSSIPTGGGVPTETFRRNVSTAAANTSRLQPHSLGAIIGQFKSVCTKRLHVAGFGDFAWQPRFYDHLIRGEKSLQTIREYVINNPAKWAQDRNNTANLYM